MLLSRCTMVVMVVLSGLGFLWGIETKPAGQVKSTITSLPRINTEIRDALQGREFAKAILLIDRALAATEPKRVVADPDYLLYLKGRAHAELGQSDEAIATFTRLEKTFPKSPWYSRSRFGQASVLSQKRNYKEAGAIYQIESERLLSSGRRDELTRIYLEFADRYFDGCPAVGPKAKQDPDYSQAINYYQQALQLRPGKDLQHKIELRIARCHQELKQFNEAIAAYQKFLANYGSANSAKANPVSPQLSAEARFHLGQTQLDAGQSAEARKTWQDFLADPVSKAQAGELVAIVNFRLARTFGIPAPPTIGDLELGVEVLDSFVKTYPKHPLATEANYNQAQSYLHHGRHDQAIQVLNSMIENPLYAKAPQVARAWNLLGQSYAAQRKFDEAIAAWRTFLERYPADQEWSQVQRVIIDTEYAAADDLRTKKEFANARKAWDTFLNKYPLDPRAAGILFQFGQMQFDEAVGLLGSVQKPEELAPAQRAQVNLLLNQAQSDWQRLVSKYPGTNEASRAALMIGITLEEKLGNLPQAVEAYKKVEGESQAAAQQRLTVLTSPQLEVVTERKFRSSEKPFIRVATRNLKSVAVKLYRVDLTDYFRKLHLASGVESLDIALIDPDQSFEYVIPHYQDYQKSNESITIPVEGAGVTAVTVSSDKHEATTMVVVSDIDVIVKSSRNELFVFAENMLTGKPAADVQLLASDGTKVFAELVTGKDGVLQKSFDELKTISDLRVFAFQGEHAASSQISLEGLQFAVGLVAKGYMYTDRPAYRAGQLVNLKGIIRWVSNDQYTYKTGEKYQLDIYDPQGRVIHTDEVVLGEFGTFAAHLQLPEVASAGQYRVHVYQPGRTQSYDMSFLVQDYQLEPIQFTIDVPQSVYYRGEMVKGKLRLKYYYGSPLVGRRVEYRLGDERLWTGQTDNQGEVSFELPTQRYSESQPLQLTAHFPERNLSTAQTIYLATRAFTVGVNTVRDVYVAGETFDSTISVNDPSGKPLATDLNIEILEVTKTAWGEGEKRVTENTIKTDEERGVAHHTLRLDKPGRYIIRATGKDRFGHRVSGSSTVLISGADDDVRLRILGDQHHFKVGERSSLKIHWREGPALALVTFEGASVLGYQIVELKTGTNPLDVTFAEHLAPNFQFSVSVMHGHRYHQASSEFKVARELAVTLSTKNAQARPGEPVAIEVLVTDTLGKPIQAELSLGMIQKNLLQRFPDGKLAIKTFFAGAQRQFACRSMASCTFEYRPSTKPINEFILAEADRVRIKQAEEDAKDLLSAAQEAAVPPQGGSSESGLGNISARWAAGRLNGVQFDTPEKAAIQNERLSELAAEGELKSEREIELAQRDHAKIPSQNQLPSILYLDDNMAVFDGNHFSNRWDDYLTVNVAADGVISQKKLSISALNGTLAMYSNGGLVIDEALQNRSIQILSQSRTNLYGINRLGELLVVNGRAEAELKVLAQQGMQLVTPQAAAETAYWNPFVLTDATGKASITVLMPDRSTAWQIRAEGINKGGLAGNAELEIITREDLFAEIQTPLAYVEGDQGQISVELHNATLKNAKVDVVLKATVGDATTVLRKVIDVAEPGIAEVQFPIAITAGKQIDLEVTVSSGDLSDVCSRSVPIEPDGLPVFASTGGTSAQNTSFEVSFPAGMKVQSPELEILLGPNVNRSLLEAIIGGPGSLPERTRERPHSQVERSVSDVLGGISVLKMIGQTRFSQVPEARDLAAHIQAGLALIVSSQREDGGWSWTGGGKAQVSDRLVTSRIIWALSMARQSGFNVPPTTFDKGIQYLNSMFAQTVEDDHEFRAIILHGLAEAGACDFSHLNRLHRLRNELNSSALVHLALSLISLDRKPMASEILALAKQKVLPLPPALPAIDPSIQGCMPWMNSGIEIRGLYLLAVNKLTPAAPGMSELADWLLSRRIGARWQSEKENGPVIMALADWFGHAKLAQEKYTLSVFVNDKLVSKLAVDPSNQPSATITVPENVLLPDQPQRVNLDIEGRGKFSYTAILAGTVQSGDPQLPQHSQRFNIHRSYQPAHRMLDGEVIPRGFHHVQSPFQTFTNSFSQLPIGERGEISISIGRYNTTGLPNEHRDYLVYTEPLPAGVSVLTETIVGNFQRYEIGPSSITFYLGEENHFPGIQFQVVGYSAGTYQHRPAVLRSYYDPSFILVSRADPLTVLPRGTASKDTYRLTPVEDYEFGKRYFARGEYKLADEHLTRLLSNYKLGEIYSEVVQMLFQTSLNASRSADIVKYFETIKEKFPDVEISFENILKVAEAYRELGEYERSYLVYRSTLEASFERESQIAGFLEEQGEFLRSVQVMEQLLRTYPAEAYIAIATYALAQEVYGKAVDGSANQKLTEAGLSRVDLIASALHMLDQFVATWPTDPAADQASFSIANTLLDLGRYAEVIQRCTDFAERYPRSKMLDSFWYVIGYSQFASGQHDAALAMCKKVAEWKQIEPATMAETVAVNHWQAIYIMGQVFHSLGKPSEAIAEYDRVKDRFPDAKEAIDFFLRKSLSLPEATTVKPGQVAKLPLRFRNVTSISVKVYRIDLLKFGLLNRDLSRITAINLAGIRPYHHLTVKLGDGKDYRDREQELELPLKEEGAYLVVCQGDNLYTSGLALVSPLILEVQEDATSGRVRVTVKNSVTEQFANAVGVKAIGSHNDQFQSGQTDLRGIFVVDGIQGTSTVIAKSNANRYAFFRGKTVLGKIPQPNSEEKPKAEATPASGEEQLLDNLRRQNNDINSFQRQNYRGLLQNKTKGIRAKEAY